MNFRHRTNTVQLSHFKNREYRETYQALLVPSSCHREKFSWPQLFTSSFRKLHRLEKLSLLSLSLQVWVVMQRSDAVWEHGLFPVIFALQLVGFLTPSTQKTRAILFHRSPLGKLVSQASEDHYPPLQLVGLWGQQYKSIP